MDYIVVLAIGIAIGGVVGEFIGRRGKQAYKNALDEAHTIIDRIQSKLP